MSKPFQMMVEQKTYQVAVQFNMVTLTVQCGDPYEAQVLFEDMAERLANHELIIFGDRQATENFKKSGLVK